MTGTASLQTEARESVEETFEAEPHALNDKLDDDAELVTLLDLALQRSEDLLQASKLLLEGDETTTAAPSETSSCAGGEEIDVACVSPVMPTEQKLVKSDSFDRCDAHVQAGSQTDAFVSASRTWTS